MTTLSHKLSPLSTAALALSTLAHATKLSPKSPTTGGVSLEGWP